MRAYFPRLSAIAMVFVVMVCQAEPARGQGSVLIDEIRVSGNQRSEAEAILNVVQTRKAMPFDRARVRQDIKSIFRLGFYNDVQVDLDTVDDKIVLTFVVVEKASIRNVEYEGNDELTDEDIGEVVDIRQYGILDLANVNRNMEKIKDLYTEKGYFLAEIDYEIVALPDNQVDVVFRIEEKQEVKVARISIVGNQVLDDAFIKERIETRENGFLSGLSGAGSFQSEAFERDQLRIAQFYYDEGYVKARVGRPKVELNPAKSEIFITIPVEEGPRYRTGTVDLSGDFLKPKEELMKLVTLDEGEWFGSGKLRDTINRLGELYKDDGYAYVNVAPNTRLDEQNRTVSLVIDIDKGKKVRIRRIEIVGNSRTRDKVIRRELRLYEGEYFSSSGLKRSERFVNRLGYFEPGSVKVRTVQGDSDDTMDLVVEVKEKPTGTFQIGAGFSSLESFMAQAQIAQNNLFGRGQSLSLNATVSSLRSTANVQFADDYFMDTRIQFATNLYRFETNFQDFVNRRLGGNLTLGYPLSDNWRTSSTYTLEQANVTAGGFGNTGRTERFATFYGSGLTSSLRQSLFYDTRNNRLFPSAGVFASGSVEHASPWLLSENLFTRYRLRGRYYYDLGFNIVSKVNAQWGLVTSPNSDGVPIFERFFVGGPLSMRGFRRNTLGPALGVIRGEQPDGSTAAVNVGGTEQMIVNLELEFPIFQKVGIRGVFFLDGGNAFDREDTIDVKLKGLRYASGFGVRWFSPIGPLRFEWGFPFDPRTGEETSVFDFSIGNFF